MAWDLVAGDFVGHPGEEIEITLKALGLGRRLTDYLAVVAGLGQTELLGIAR